MVPALRAQRLREIAARVQTEFAGDLRGALLGPSTQARKAIKKFPNIADPGADRILLFGAIAPIAAVPSNCPHVLVRIQQGPERESYAANYAEAQRLIDREVAPSIAARTRAYLLLKRHGQGLCKRAKPKCEQCPVTPICAYHVGTRRRRA